MSSQVNSGPESTYMNSPNSKNLIIGNIVLWIFAALVYPVSQWVPTGAGTPPRVFEVLIPVIMILMGMASTSFLRTALRQAGCQ